MFFYRDELGFSLDLIGKLGASTSIVFLVMAYPFGVLLDRWGCHKTMILGYALMTLGSVLAFCFAVNRWSAIALMLLRSLPMSLCGLAFSKWTVEVYPQDRYGQFGSAGALVCSIGGILLGLVCAAWMDWVKVYRYFLAWSAAFTLFGTVAATVVYQRWKAFGGAEAYRAP